MSYIAIITCRCGHQGKTPVIPGVLRAETLRRARCSVCGKRDAVDVIVSGSHLPPYRGHWPTVRGDDQSDRSPNDPSSRIAINARKAGS